MGVGGDELLSGNCPRYMPTAEVGKGNKEVVSQRRLDTPSAEVRKRKVRGPISDSCIFFYITLVKEVVHLTKMQLQ